jgi:hypothetical protein
MRFDGAREGAVPTIRESPKDEVALRGAAIISDPVRIDLIYFAVFVKMN